MNRRSLGLLLLGCLLAFASPLHGAPQDQTHLVTLHVQQGDLIARVLQVDVCFNPKEYALDKSIPWESSKAHEDAPLPEFKEPLRMTLAVTLQFDTFENSQTPCEFSDILKGLIAKAAVIPVTWHRRLWTSTLLAANPVFTKFDPKGNPTRVLVKTTWTEFDLVEPEEIFGFTVDIPGCPQAATDIREIDIDPLDLGANSPPLEKHARFTIADRGELLAELVRWQQETDSNVTLCRLSTVRILKGRTHIPVRSFTLNARLRNFTVLPAPEGFLPHIVVDVDYDHVSFNPVPPVQNVAEAPKVALGQATNPLPSPFFGFTATLTEAQGNQESAFFKSVGGLKVDTEVTDFEEGGIHGAVRRLSGKAPWPNLTLGGPPSEPQPLFQSWLNVAAQGNSLGATVTITPLYLFNGQPRPTRPLVCPDARPDRYVFPSLSAVRSNGIPQEKISLAPVLGELMGPN